MNRYGQSPSIHISGESMKRLLALVLLLFSIASTAYAYTPKDGDIVFQASHSSQSLAIQTATSSPYSHVGVVLIRKGKPYVLEAIQPVKFTPLKAWLDHGHRRAPSVRSASSTGCCG